MNKEKDIMSNAELAALKKGIDEHGKLTFPVTQEEAMLIKRVLDAPSRGIKGWAAKSLSAEMSESFEGYRNVLYFIESLGKELVDVSVVEKGLMIKIKSSDQGKSFQ